MQIFRRFINYVQQLSNDVYGYTPRGRNLVEAELKLRCYQSLIQCATLIFKSLICVIIFARRRRNTFSLFFNWSGEFSFIDFCYSFSRDFFWGLLGTSTGQLLVERRFNSFFFFHVMVLLAISFGELFEFGWYFSTGEWLRYRKYCNVCGNRFQDLFLIPAFHLYQIYKCAMAIYNFVHAKLQLREHQKMLDSLPKFKLNSKATKGG